MNVLLTTVMLLAATFACSCEQDKAAEITDQRDKSEGKLRDILTNATKLEVVVRVLNLGDDREDVRNLNLRPFEVRNDDMRALTLALLSAFDTSSHYPGVVPSELLRFTGKQGEIVELGCFPDRFFLYHCNDDEYLWFTMNPSVSDVSGAIIKQAHAATAGEFRARKQ